MKLRASFPFISLLAAVIAFVGWGVVWVPKVKAQQKPAPQNAQAAPARASGDLNERIARLEQRILDMQGVIATLQSFVRDGGASPAQGGFPPAGGLPAGGGAGGAPSEINIRVLALETQIRALTGQMEQINTKLDQMPAGAGVTSPSPDVGQRLGAAPQVGSPQLGSPQLKASGGGAQFGRPTQPAPAPAPAPQFGTSTAPPAPGNPFDRAMQDSPQRPPAPQVPPVTRQSEQLPGLSGLSSTGGGGSRGVYDASYQSFLRNDLSAAEKGFSSFVKSYPDDALASNAHYWLGRTYYQRKKFEPAAKAFLAGYKKDKKSAIAPDALLHLGMSLAQLGEKDAACSTLKAIAKQFPDASGTLKQDAASALKRTRC
jgi:tol-pal system protein YbgF